jgi:hypothetical protein
MDGLLDHRRGAERSNFSPDRRSDRRRFLSGRKMGLARTFGVRSVVATVASFRLIWFRRMCFVHRRNLKWIRGIVPALRAAKSRQSLNLRQITSAANGDELQANSRTGWCGCEGASSLQ